MKLATPQPPSPAPVVTVFLRPAYGITAGKGGLAVSVSAAPADPGPKVPSKPLRLVEA